ncbi:MAG: hypothetical protein KC613_19735, partial [Myxococcales bacterium]|nr:hypothetical protein [Myxococcales bacterium]
MPTQPPLTPLAALAACAPCLLFACADEPAPTRGGHDLPRLVRVLETNAAIAHAAYSDAVDEAIALKGAVEALRAAPGPQTLAAARRAWRVAREPYGQTEVYRFRGSPIDDTDGDPGNGEDGPEGMINAWPLGEALIDYVVLGGDFGVDEVGVTAHGTGVAEPIPGNNLIHSLDIPLDAALLAHSVTAEDEHDVIAGYHAAEFLLWGQDLNADGTVTDGDRTDAVKVPAYLEAQGALTTHGGQRPASDFDATEGLCTSGAGNQEDPRVCARRGLYLALVFARPIGD